MNIIVQNLNDEISYGLAIALQYSGLSPTLWQPQKKSIFDMFHQGEPNLVIVHSSLFKTNAEELLAAKNKYGGTLYIVGLELDGEDFIGRPLIPFANIVESANRQLNDKFKTDVALIVDYLRPTDYQYIDDIFSLLNSLNIQSRIYGNIKFGYPNYVGKVNRGDIQNIYRSSKVVLDLYGEHYLTPFLHGNLGLCEIVNRQLFPTDRWQNINDLSDISNRLKYGLTEEKSSILRAEILEKHTGFDETAKILGVAGFVDESLIVLENKRKCVAEFWT